MLLGKNILGREQNTYGIKENNETSIFALKPPFEKKKWTRFRPRGSNDKGQTKRKTLVLPFSGKREVIRDPWYLLQIIGLTSSPMITLRYFPFLYTWSLSPIIYVKEIVLYKFYQPFKRNDFVFFIFSCIFY